MIDIVTNLALLLLQGKSGLAIHLPCVSGQRHAQLVGMTFLAVVFKIRMNKSKRTCAQVSSPRIIQPTIVASKNPHTVGSNQHKTR